MVDDLLEVADDTGIESHITLGPMKQSTLDTMRHNYQRNRHKDYKEYIQEESASSSKKSPQINSRKKSSEVFNVFHKADAAFGQTNASPREKQNNLKDESSHGGPSTMNHSEKNTSMKDNKTSSVSPQKSSSPILDSKIGLFLKSRMPFGPFQNSSQNMKVKTSPVKTPQGDFLGDDVSMTHMRTHSDSPTLKTIFLSSSTPSSPTAMKRYISTTCAVKEGGEVTRL